MKTNFSKIVYDDSYHSYAINGKKLVSASTVADLLTPPFDRDTILAAQVAKKGQSKEDILKEWDETGKFGRDRGSRLHQFVEDTMAGRVDPILRAINDPLPEMDAFETAWGRLVVGKKARLCKKEWIIGDEELGVAGRVDALITVELDGVQEYCVFDWKTGKFDIKSYGDETLLPPLGREPSTKLTQYSIQLSLYRLILERNNPKDNFGDAYLVHLRPDGTVNTMRAKDYRKPLKEWLLAGAPELAHDPQIEKRTKQIIRQMEEIGEATVGSVSQKTRTRLGKLAEQIRNLCNP
jgi:hypothetical protein